MIIVVLQPKLLQWVIKIVLFLFSWYRTEKGTLFSIVHWPMMIISLYLFFILKYHRILDFLQVLNLWSIGYLLSQFSESVKEHHKLRFTSTEILTGTKIPFPQHSKHLKRNIGVSWLRWSISWLWRQ